MTSLDPATVRVNLRRLIDAHGISMAALSRMIGRNAAYVQQFVAKGSPERLPERERLILAQFFGVDERELGARDPWSPSA